MGINNLNNQANFGKLTTGNIANTKSAQVKNVNVNVNVNAQVKNAEVLNSATLKEGVGEKFDSNGFGKNDPVYAAAPGKGWWGRFVDHSHNYREQRGANPNFDGVTYMNPSTEKYMAITTACSFVYGAWRATFG